MAHLKYPTFCQKLPHVIISYKLIFKANPYIRQLLLLLKYCNYGTAQMQLHIRARVLLYQHMCANMLPFTCDEGLASPTYCTHVLHEGLHTRVT